MEELIKKVTATVIKDYTRSNLRADLAISATDPVTFGQLTVGADSDGSDRTITFGHSTLKSIIGIDDSADVFAINTDDTFESGNDFEIDASGNVTISHGSIIVANGEVKTPTIAFSDGDNAITIADGGVCTFPQRAVFSSGLELNDSDILVGGIAKMDRVAGVADGNTFIDFGPSDVLTFKTGGTTAATINSSQLFTASAGITSTAVANTFGATSFSDADITNVGSISVDTIASDGSDITIDAGGDISLDAASGNIRILDGGALRCAIDTDSNADEIRFNIEEDDSEFVFRQYDDTEVLRIKDNASLGLLNAQATLSHSSNTVILDIPTANDDFKISGDDGGTDIVGLKIDFGAAAKTSIGADESFMFEPDPDADGGRSPKLTLESSSTTNSAQALLRFNKDITGSSNEELGRIEWYGKDSSGNPLEEMGNIYVKVTDAAAGSETAKMYLSTKNSGTLYEMGMKFTGTYDIVWPSTNGSSDNVLSTDGSGNLSWSSISGLSGGGESNQDAFSIIAVSGQTSCTADSATDTLTLAAAGGMTITTSGDTVTLNSANTNTTYTGGTNLTLSGTTFNVDDAFLKNNANDTTSGTITAGGFTTTGSITLGGHAVADIDVSSEASEANDHLMTSLAIKNFIEDYGYTTATGDITGVTAGTGLSGGGSSGGVTLTNAGVTSAVAGSGIDVSGATGAVTISIGTGEVVNAMIGDDEINSEHYAAGSIDNEHIADDAINSEHYAAGSIDEEHLNSSNTPQDNYLLSYNASTTGFTWVVSPSGGGGDDNESAFKTFSVSGQSDVVADADADTMTFAASGGMTITTNASTDTITFSSANDNTTYSTFAGSTTPGTAALVPARDAGNTTGKYLREDGDWVVPPDTNSNTTYSAGSLLDLSSTTFNVDLSELTDGTSDIDSNDEVVYLDNGSQKRKAFSELKLSEFNNDSGFTTNTGDITGVTAGTGMSGGGTSGGVTLTNAGVTSIVAGSGISISGATGAVTVTASGGGGGGSGTVNSGTATALTHYASTGTAVDDTITSTASLTADLTGNLPELMLYREDTSVSGTNGIARLEMGNTDFSSGRTAPNFQIQAQSGGVSQSSGSEGGCSVLFKSISTGSSTLTTRMKLGTDGEVQDNNGDPAFIKNMQLSPGGTGTMLINQVGAGAFTFDSVSDETVKHERRAFDYGLKEIELLQPEHYKFNKEAYDELGITPQPEKHHEVEHQGLMAQDIEKIMPELVYDNALNVEGVKNYHRDGITAALINAVKNYQQELLN